MNEPDLVPLLTRIAEALERIAPETAAKSDLSAASALSLIHI